MIFDMTRRVSGGGSGPSASDAILTVTVLTGSTVTAVKGGVTLTPTMWVQAADATQDCALFVIAPAQFDSVNPWTVTATLGTNSVTATMTIDSNKQYDVELAYGLYFFKNGKIVIQPDTHPYPANVSETNDYVSVKFAGSASTAYATWKLTSALLGGKSYSSLVFVVHSWTPTNSFSGIGLGRNEVTWNNEVISASPSGVTFPHVFTLDCSNVTLQNLYLFVRVGQSNQEALFDSIYFEE